MASSYTTNYQLNQWEAGDQVLRTEFNQDNQKIDTALAGLGNRSEALETALEKKGNCEVWTTTYIGQGGSYPQRAITFPWTPLAVMIIGTEGYIMTVTPGQSTVYVGPASYEFEVTWDGNTLSWDTLYYGSDRLNEDEVTYRIIAFRLVV